MHEQTKTHEGHLLRSEKQYPADWVFGHRGMGRQGPAHPYGPAVRRIPGRGARPCGRHLWRNYHRNRE